jgi:transcriptional regulator of aromatic amino acid metabolism
MVANLSIYDEISGFIASMNPEKVVAFKPSKANQDKLDSLLEKQKETILSVEEKTELEYYLIINRIVGLAKAHAIKILRG